MIKLSHHLTYLSTLIADICTFLNSSPFSEGNLSPPMRGSRLASSTQCDYMPVLGYWKVGLSAFLHANTRRVELSRASQSMSSYAIQKCILLCHWLCLSLMCQNCLHNSSLHSGLFIRLKCITHTKHMNTPACAPPPHTYQLASTGWPGKNLLTHCRYKAHSLNS